RTMSLLKFSSAANRSIITSLDWTVALIGGHGYPAGRSVTRSALEVSRLAAAAVEDKRPLQRVSAGSRQSPHTRQPD
ncbi:MAG TPA: hypothetical protein VI387_08145, partial [Candidatus Brocadiales bacterium]|nr:hypothetical protein [Candidatus Brocadiales bacterium]